MGLACADQSHAQILDQNGPLGIIGWSSSAPLCQVLPGSPAIFINYGAPSSVSSLNAGHTYDVEMYLYRPKSLAGIYNCNPTAYAAFIESFLE
jgi:hypothetical protein